MTDQPSELFTKVLELNRAGGFKSPEFFVKLLDLVWHGSLPDLQAVEPMLSELSGPGRYRAPNERESDGMVFMLYGVVEHRIEELETQRAELEPGSLAHRVLYGISKPRWSELFVTRDSSVIARRLGLRISQVEDATRLLQDYLLIEWEGRKVGWTVTREGTQWLRKHSAALPEQAPGSAV